jgi:V8-like Glu-specific endopeptidase
MTDSRTPVTNTNGYLWEYVGKWVINNQQYNNLVDGSGVLIGSQYVLTAGHVYEGQDYVYGLVATGATFDAPISESATARTHKRNRSGISASGGITDMARAAELVESDPSPALAA